MQAWRPHQKGMQYIKVYKVYEAVGKSVEEATKLVPGFNSLRYQERLRKLKLMTLELSRLSADLIEVFEILKRMDIIDKERLFEIRVSSVYGFQYKLFKATVNLNTRKFFFSHRVINAWNSLPPKAVESKTVKQFESYINHHIYTHYRNYTSPSQ